MTEIDGQDIHFIHVRSKHENALPLIVTHGWPGSIIEQTKIIDLLTDPTAHGASASDAFHLVIPSIPGYGYSPEPTTLGWDPVRVAKAWVVLMERLGYSKFVAQGGDWGLAITQELALLAPAQVLGHSQQHAGYRTGRHLWRPPSRAARHRPAFPATSCTRSSNSKTSMGIISAMPSR